MSVNFKLFLLPFSLLLCSCQSLIAQGAGQQSNAEKSFAETHRDPVGKLLKIIEFKVKTDNETNFSDGTQTGVDLEMHGKDISAVIDGDKIVIDKNAVSITIDYPLTNPYHFELRSKNGFTRSQLLKAIIEHYHQIYQEEEASATVKTLPMNERKTLINRNTTNGKYGIWGHDIADLVLTDVSVYETDNKEIVLILGIDS